MTPQLNWQELSLSVEKIRSHVEGLFVDRIIVPERPLFPEGYLKGEWAIRLVGRKGESTLLFSIRPRHPYLAWCAGKGPKAATQATRSPFDLSLSKHLKGAKLLEVQPISRDRSVILWFSQDGSSENRLGLVLVFIPAAPEALLVSAMAGLDPTSGWPVMSRSRTIREDVSKARYLLPDTSNAPPHPKVREELLHGPDSLFHLIQKELEGEAFTLRLQNSEKQIKQRLKLAQDRVRQSETALREAQQEPDWQNYGDQLKATLSNPPPLTGNIRKIIDYTTGKTLSIPCDLKLSLPAQVQKFYQNSRRRQRRIAEAQTRIQTFQKAILQFQSALSEKPTPGNWKDLEKWEKLGGHSLLTTGASGSAVNSKKNHGSGWLGKTFHSQDGLLIWVGRNKDENLELTFKHARGNDIWMHVRGRPGAHVVIPLPSGKSAPLSTLLEAATLAIYYSGGQNWGKTEVDYTFKKYVRRIKDSTEASYTHNKTLLVELNQERLKKFLEEG